MENSRSFLESGFKGEQMIVVPRGVIKRFDRHELISSLYLTDIGFFPNARNHFRNRPNGCGEYILIYCVEGRGTITQNGIDHDIQPNTFFIIEKDVAHKYESHRTDPWSIYWVHFVGHKSLYLFKQFTKQNQGGSIFIPFSQDRIEEFDFIINLLERGSTNQLFEYSSMLLHKLLGSFIYYSLKSPKNPDLAKEDLVKRITEYLNEKLYESLTLSDVEREFNKSSSSLFTIFKEKTGYSIMHFFSLIKIQKACELMNLTDLSIKEISYRLDYRDPLYFSRVFKKFMGMSPMSYKKNK